VFDETTVKWPNGTGGHNNPLTHDGPAPELIDTLRLDFEKFVLDALRADLIKGARSRPATVQSTFDEIETLWDRRFARS